MNTITDQAGMNSTAMTGQAPKPEQRDLQRQRSRAVRTAWALAAIALLIFAAFIISGVLGESPHQ